MAGQYELNVYNSTTKESAGKVLLWKRTSSPSLVWNKAMFDVPRYPAYQIEFAGMSF